MSLPRPDSSTASPREWAARLAAPVAAVLAMASLAAFQADPRAAAESAYLALATGMALLAAAAAASRGTAGAAGGPWPVAVAVAGPLLVTAAVWTLPAGPARSAVAMALAAAVLAAAVLRWLPGRAEQGGGASRVVPAVAIAVGLQALLRGGELLGFATDPGAVARSALVFAAFPAVGAAAVLVLARLHGRRRALLAAAAVLLVGPGFRPATLAVLAALVAAPALLRRDPPAAWRPTGAVRSPAGGRWWLAVRLGALGLLAAPFAWDVRAGAAALAAGLAGAAVLGGEWPAGLRSRSRPWLWLWLPAAPAAAALALALSGRPWEEAVPLAALVPLALPALALPDRGRAPLALAALVLAAAAARGVLVEGALAAPAALAALAVPRRGPVAAVQGAWSGALLAAVSLLAAYPWLRPAPLPDALALFGLPPGLPGALAAVAGLALLAGLGLLLGRSGRAGGSEPASLRAAAAALVALALLRVPAAGATPLDTPALVLDGDRPAWTAALGSGPDGGPPGVRAVVLDSSLANAAGLPAGTPVATLRLRDPGGPDRTWTLATGGDTGEWAADRPDLRALRPPAPDPWLSWVAEDGAFFGRRYRTVLRLEEASSLEHLELRLRPDLPPEVALSVFHLELRP